MAKDSISSSAKSSDTCAYAQANRDKALIIALSGCSSSGKTLLSLLLKAVFTGPDISVPGPGNSPNISTPLVIHEDDYFIPKRNCPLVTFKTTLADTPFILKSLRHDSQCSYYLHKDNEIPSIDDDPLQTIVQEMVPLWRVTGPDTDCWEVINVPALTKTLVSLKTMGIPEEHSVQHTGLEESMADAGKWTQLIQEMQQVVKHRFAIEAAITDSEKEYPNLSSKNILNPKEMKSGIASLCFVEGLLLYIDPDTEDASSIQYENDVISANENAATQYDVADTHPHVSTICRPHKPDRTGYASFKISSGRTTTYAEKQALIDNFGIMLFLPTSRDVAKARRFSRKPYMDYPLGGRKEGQHWKTEGYFDGVAWPNYERLHSWLLRSDNNNPVEDEFEGTEDAKILVGDVASLESQNGHWKKGDIHVRKVDASVEDTLRWAVDVILGEMSKHAQTRVYR